MLSWGSPARWILTKPGPPGQCPLGQDIEGGVWADQAGDWGQVVKQVLGHVWENHPSFGSPPHPWVLRVADRHTQPSAGMLEGPWSLTLHPASEFSGALSWILFAILSEVTAP